MLARMGQLTYHLSVDHLLNGATNPRLQARSDVGHHQCKESNPLIDRISLVHRTFDHFGPHLLPHMGILNKIGYVQQNIEKPADLRPSISLVARILGGPGGALLLSAGRRRAPTPNNRCQPFLCSPNVATTAASCSLIVNGLGVACEDFSSWMLWLNTPCKMLNGLVRLTNTKQ